MHYLNYNWELFQSEAEKILPQVESEISTSTYLEDALVLKAAEKIVRPMLLSNPTLDYKFDIINYIYYAIRGFDVLAPLLEDPSINEIMVNGYKTIYIEDGMGMRKIPISFYSKERLDNLIQKIVSEVNRSVNQSSPIVDARLKDGSRVNIVLDPVALNGPVITIRKFSQRIIDLQTMVENGTITDEVKDFLRKIVREKYNFFVAGGTSSGKTTLLNALVDCIPSTERIITIEDSVELKVSKDKNHIALETRNPNSEGAGEITMDSLIKTALRMRPDRIIVGEVRGKECFAMLQAMNSGHNGSCSTGHANSNYDMLTRLQSMMLMAANIPLDAIKQQICSALDIIIYVARDESGKRRVVEISEVVGEKFGELGLKPIFRLKEGELVRCEELSQKIY